ncbi:MAG: hypothetical protein U0L88_10885 [Acutalibacteraceae bacterium]|nr:hypothetical protein [Acutalibacteraceae bacterium]MEE1049052.1 hypothetical protein [Clostridia bacterium]
MKTENYNLIAPEKLGEGSSIKLDVSIEKYIFGKLYAGSFSKKLYRLFEYRKA